MQSTQLQDDTLTDEQFEWMLVEEKKWRDSLPQLSYFQLLEIYGPQCYPAAIRGLRARINRCKENLAHAEEIRNKYYKTVVNKAPWKDKWFWKLICEEIHIKPLTEGREATIKKSLYFIAFIKSKQKGVNAVSDPTKITDEDIARAKEVPIESLFSGQLRKQGGRATGVCPFHNERSGSFTVYLKQNKFYCYGCHVEGDIIDFVSRQQNVEFLQAVKILLNRV